MATGVGHAVAAVGGRGAGGDDLDDVEMAAADDRARGDAATDLGRGGRDRAWRCAVCVEGGLLGDVSRDARHRAVDRSQRADAPLDEVADSLGNDRLVTAVAVATGVVGRHVGRRPPRSTGSGSVRVGADRGTGRQHGDAGGRADLQCREPREDGGQCHGDDPRHLLRGVRGDVANGLLGLLVDHG